MRKLYFAILLCIVGIQAMAQSVTTILYASGAPGSWTTGSSTSTVAGEGMMTVSSGGPIVERAFAKFDLSTLPADAVITSVTFGAYAASYTSLGMATGTATTYGYAGDLGTLSGTPATLFSSMVAPVSTPLSTTSYGTTTGNKRLLLDPPANGFVQGHIGGIISIAISTTQPRIYQFVGESGLEDTTGGHAPYLLITYKCGSLSSISAVASPTTICSGSSVALTGSAVGADSYTWSGPSGVISATNTATASPTVAESYTLSITSAMGCTVDSVVHVNVNPSPSNATSTSGPTAFCLGGSVDLSVSSPFPIYTYQWFESGIAISGATNSMYHADTTGDYTVQITNTSVGCSAVSVGIPVVALDVPTLTPSGLVHVCSSGGGSALLTVNTGGVTSGLTYQWKKDGVTIAGATNDTYVATASGVYVAEVSTTGGGCIVNSTATTVDLASYPTPAVTYNGSVISTTNTYLSYQWYLNSVAITGATSYNYVPTMNGTYRVRVTSTSGCVNYSASLAIGNVGVAEQSIGGISIYPNPATNIVRIDAAYIVNAVVTTIDGRTIMEQKAATGLSISHLPDGIYLIRLYDQDGQQVAVRKLVKE